MNVVFANDASKLLKDFKHGNNRQNTSNVKILPSPPPYLTNIPHSWLKKFIFCGMFNTSLEKASKDVNHYIERNPQKNWLILQNLILLKPFTNNQLITTVNHYCSVLELHTASNQTLNPPSSQQINLRSSTEDAQN